MIALAKRGGPAACIIVVLEPAQISTSAVLEPGAGDSSTVNALVSILDDLKEHACAVRRRDRADRRRHMMEITEKGREALADLLSRARENEAPARNVLSKEEFRALTFRSQGAAT